MNATEYNIAFAAHLRAEHCRLHAKLMRIKQDWQFMNKQSPSLAAIDRLSQDLADLRKELASHFQEEEEGASLEEAVCRCPSLGYKSDQIVGEHSPMLARLDLIIERLLAWREAAEDANELQRDFEQFAKMLHAHECAENELLERAFGFSVE